MKRGVHIGVPRCNPAKLRVLLFWASSGQMTAVPGLDLIVSAAEWRKQADKCLKWKASSTS